MRILTILSTIGLLVFATNGQQPTLKHRGNIDIDAMSFEANHVSMAKDDQMNYDVGRAMIWDGAGASYTHATAGSANAGIRQGQAGKKTPDWVYNLQGKAKAYQTDRINRTKKYESRLSGYSATEIRIAQSLGKNPWELNRKQLKKWAQEADGIIP